MNSFLFILRVAIRYLQPLRQSKRVKYLRLLTLFFLMATAAIFLAHKGLIPEDKTALTRSEMMLHQTLVIGKYLSVLTTTLVFVFVELMVRFTIFTTISTFGMFVGTGALVTVISLMTSMRDDLKSKMLDSHAHILIEPKGKPYFAGYREMSAQVERIPGVVSAIPELSMGMMIADATNREQNDEVIARGVDAQSLSKMQDLAKHMKQGALENLIHPPGSKIPGLVIGQELAARLGLIDPTTQTLQLGTLMVLASPVSTGVNPLGNLPTIRSFQIVGMFYTGMYEYDSKYVYILLPKMQKLAGLDDDQAGGIEIKISNVESSEKLIKPIQQVVGEGYRVEDWKTRNRAFFSSLELEKIVMFFGLGLILLVAACSIISNGLMLVAEKTQEIAILKSMGATDGSILGIFTTLGLIVGVLGIGLGVLIGVAICHLLTRYGLPLSEDVYYITKIHIFVKPLEVAMICGFSLLLVLLATLSPARNAARLKPLEGLK